MSLRARAYTYGARSEDTANCTQDKVRVLLWHDRDDHVEDGHPEEAVGKDWSRRVQVGYSAPEQQERGKRDRVGGLLVSTPYPASQTITDQDPRGRLILDSQINRDLFRENEKARISESIDVLS